MPLGKTKEMLTENSGNVAAALSSDFCPMLASLRKMQRCRCGENRSLVSRVHDTVNICPPAA